MKRKLVVSDHLFSRVLLLSDAALLLFVVTYSLMWVCYIHRDPLILNILEFLVAASFLIVFPYLAATPTIAILYFFKGRRDRGGIPVAPLKRTVVTCRAMLHIMSWILIPLSFVVAIPWVIGGDRPFYFECFRYIEGPDTDYARNGFEQLLKLPVPPHVSTLYYRNLDGFTDKQILEFKTSDPPFIDGIIRNLGLIAKEVPSEPWQKIAPGAPPHYTKEYRHGPYTLFCNRETGEVAVLWWQ